MDEEVKMREAEARAFWNRVFVLVVPTTFIVVAGSMWGCPQYKVYSARLDGEAKLAHAQAEREVQVRDAQGKLEASTLLANADIERAKGVAQSNKIIGTSLQNNEAYLKWLYIDGLKEKNNLTTIYVPTEAGLPILEAGKRK